MSFLDSRASLTEFLRTANSHTLKPLETWLSLAHDGLVRDRRNSGRARAQSRQQSRAGAGVATPAPTIARRTTRQSSSQGNQDWQALLAQSADPKDLIPQPSPHAYGRVLRGIVVHACRAVRR
eukprot:SAG31_NODE_10781_length_1098_cov_1.599600_2_plen_123_part_00